MTVPHYRYETFRRPPLPLADFRTWQMKLHINRFEWALYRLTGSPESEPFRPLDDFAVRPSSTTTTTCTLQSPREWRSRDAVCPTDNYLVLGNAGSILYAHTRAIVLHNITYYVHKYTSHTYMGRRRPASENFSINCRSTCTGTAENSPAPRARLQMLQTQSYRHNTIIIIIMYTMHITLWRLQLMQFVEVPTIITKAAPPHCTSLIHYIYILYIIIINIIWYDKTAATSATDAAV